MKSVGAFNVRPRVKTGLRKSQICNLWRRMNGRYALARAADILTTSLHELKPDDEVASIVGVYIVYIYNNGVVTSREILVGAVKRWSSHAGP